jgi:hypothetical protein
MHMYSDDRGRGRRDQLQQPPFLDSLSCTVPAELFNLLAACLSSVSVTTW